MRFDDDQMYENYEKILMYASDALITIFDYQQRNQRTSPGNMGTQKIKVLFHVFYSTEHESSVD